MSVGVDAIVLADDQQVERPSGSPWPDRWRSLATSIGPAILILVAQQLFFPMSGGLVIRGLIIGALTALIALGMSLIYRANRIVNFAQADMGFAPTVLAYLLIRESGWPYPVAAGVGLLTAIALGAAIERFVVRRFFRSPRLLVTIATIGLSQVLAGVALLLPRLWDRDIIQDKIPTPFDFTHRLFGTNFDANDLLALIVAPLLVAAVAVFLQRSDAGVAIRASADSADRAALLGIPVFRLQTLVWSLAAALAFATVFLRSGILGLPIAGSALGLSLLLRSLVALVIGRMTDLVAVTAAALSLGVLDQAVDHNKGFIYTYPVLGLVLVVAIVVRRKEVGARGSEVEQTAWRAAEDVRPVPRSLRWRPEVWVLRSTTYAVVAVVALLLPAVLDTDQVFKASALLIYAILGLSLVLLSGWGGTVSLGHAAFFGLGAAVAGSAILNLDIDLLPALVLAAAVGAAVGALVGIPAMRLHGLYLVVTTFGFGLAATAYFLNDEFFGWVPNERIERAPLLGGFEVASERGVYYLILVVLLLAILGLRNIRATRFGRALVALRDNDRAAQAYAIHPQRVQLMAFALSGAIAGIAGALFVHHERAYDPSSYGGLQNVAVFVIVVVGGMTSATGAVLGALFVLGTQWFLSDEWAVVAQGAGVVVVLLLFPGGLASVVFDVRDRIPRAVAARTHMDVPGYSRAGPDTGDEGPGAPTAPRSPAGGPSSDGDGLLQAKRLDVGYGGVPVLFGVDVSVRDGEAVALLGTNGAGKSTLLRAISGLLDPTSGEVVFDGRNITGRAAHKVAAEGIVQMPGGRGVFPTLTVAENLRAAGWLHRRDRAAVAAGVERVQRLFPVLVERAGERAGNLSGGQQQMLALAMSVLGRPKLLMIDELSLGLAPSVVAELMRFVGQLRADGTSLLLVEQSVNVALEMADRAVFLERGEVRFSGQAADLLERPDLLRSVFLSAVSAPDPAVPTAAMATTTASTAPVLDPEAPPVLATVDLSATFGGLRAVDDVSLEVRQGEIVGVIGPNGAGKTTLFDLLSGFILPTGGRVELRGRDVTRLSAAARARRGLGRSFQDARLFGGLTIEEAIAAALERWVHVGDPLSAAFYLPNAYDSEVKVRRRVGELVELLGLQPYRSLFIGELSTGTRRIVDLACLLAHRPSIVLLDEPAAGIAQREVEALPPLIRRIRDEMGASVVVVEHDIPLVEEVADRIVAMDRGRVLAVGSPSAVLTDPAVVHSYLGDNDAAVRRSGTRDMKEELRATEQ